MKRGPDPEPPESVRRQLRGDRAAPLDREGWLYYEALFRGDAEAARDNGRTDIANGYFKHAAQMRRLADEMTPA